MRGQKYNDDIKEKAYALLAVNSNAQLVARELNLPYTTVRTWQKKWLASPYDEELDETEEVEEVKEDINEVANESVNEVTNESTKKVTNSTFSGLAELRRKNKEKFINDAWGLIDKTKTILERRLDRAIESENEIDKLVEEITQLDYKTLTDTQRKSLYTRISAIKVESLKEIAVVLGTLYDKQALANKEATTIVEGNIEVKKFEDF
jgi:transposase-like protein